MPKWFARLFAVVMVLACVATAWYAYQHEKLNFAIEDVRVSLETSQARERKQQYEYDQVSKALPAAKLELSEIKPKAEQAKQEETLLRENRKVLRENNASLTAQVDTADSKVESVKAAYTLQLTALNSVTEQVETDMTSALSFLYRSMSDDAAALIGSGEESPSISAENVPEVPVTETPTEESGVIDEPSSENESLPDAPSVSDEDVPEVPVTETPTEESGMIDEPSSEDESLLNAPSEVPEQDEEPAVENESPEGITSPEESENP